MGSFGQEGSLVLSYLVSNIIKKPIGICKPKRKNKTKTKTKTKNKKQKEEEEEEDIIGIKICSFSFTLDRNKIFLNKKKKNESK